jgi:hypothetical protein
VPPGPRAVKALSAYWPTSRAVQSVVVAPRAPRATVRTVGPAGPFQEGRSAYRGGSRGLSMEAVDAAAQYKNSGKLGTKNAGRGGIEEQQKVAVAIFDATVTLVYLNLNTKTLNPEH